MIVIGGPQFCGYKLPESLEVKVHERTGVRVAVCGHPRPTVTWEYQGQKLNSTFEIGTRPMEFIFSTSLPQVTLHNCGNRLTYRASGLKGVIVGSMNIKVLCKLNIS